MRTSTYLYLVLFLFLISGCATRSTAPETDTGSKIGGAVTAPLEDLNLIRTKIPPVLVEAREHPYRLLSVVDCTNIGTEVTALNEALGPDLDVQPSATEQSNTNKATTLAGDTAIDALRSTTTGVIPFHGWVRKLTGAERHSREVASAIVAGFVRRAYLKGLGEANGCMAPAAPLPPAPADEERKTVVNPGSD